MVTTLNFTFDQNPGTNIISSVVILKICNFIVCLSTSQKLEIQSGDPTVSGQGGESIYGGPFSDEFHSRLRFKHTGLVACSGSGSSPNSNASQFFITLGRCDWLDKKNTIFGKLTGDSICNLLQLG